MSTLELFVQLYDQVAQGNLAAAQEVAEQIGPLEVQNFLSGLNDFESEYPELTGATEQVVSILTEHFPEPDPE